MLKKKLLIFFIIMLISIVPVMSVCADETTTTEEIETTEGPSTLPTTEEPSTELPETTVPTTDPEHTTVSPETTSQETTTPQTTTAAPTTTTATETTTKTPVIFSTEYYDHSGLNVTAEGLENIMSPVDLETYKKSSYSRVATTLDTYKLTETDEQYIAFSNAIKTVKDGTVGMTEVINLLCYHQGYNDNELAETKNINASNGFITVKIPVSEDLQNALTQNSISYDNIIVFEYGSPNISYLPKYDTVPSGAGYYITTDDLGLHYIVIKTKKITAYAVTWGKLKETTTPSETTKAATTTTTRAQITKASSSVTTIPTVSGTDKTSIVETTTAENVKEKKNTTGTIIVIIIFLSAAAATTIIILYILKHNSNNGNGPNNGNNNDFYESERHQNKNSFSYSENNFRYGRFSNEDFNDDNSFRINYDPVDDMINDELKKNIKNKINFENPEDCSDFQKKEK